MNISRSGPAMVEPGSKRPGVARRAALVGAAVMAMGLGAVAPAQASISTTQVQWDLAGMGYLPWSGIDGSYGPQTTSAVKTFQSHACIATDGQAGPITEGKLAMWAIIAVGLFNSIMFPTIFTLTLERSSAPASATSGLMCMAICGGGFISVLYGFTVDQLLANFSVGARSLAFIVPLLCYIFVFLFSH